MPIQLVIETKTVKLTHLPLRLFTAIQTPVTVWAQQTKNDGAVGTLLVPSFTQVTRNGAKELLIDTVKSSVLQRGLTYTITIVGQLEVSSGTVEVSDEDVTSTDITSTDTMVTLDGTNVREQILQLLDVVTDIDTGSTPDDFDVGSANITSTDTTVTLTGANVRGQLQQLLDEVTDVAFIDSDIASANLTSTDTTLTINGGNVRGQLLDIIDAITTVSVSVADTDVTSANISATDGLTTLNGTHVRGQLQQLLADTISRHRRQELGLVMESLCYRHEAGASATLDNPGVILYFNWTASIQNRWGIFRSNSTGFSHTNAAFANGGGTANAASNPAFTVVCACWNPEAALTSVDTAGTIVAAGASGGIASEASSTTFTARTAGSGYTGTFRGAVNLGASGFLLAGTAGEIQTSPTGVTWTRRYNTGGDFVSAVAHDDMANVVCIRAASFVHSANGGVSGHTDAALPLTGAMFIAYHKAFGYLVMGTDGTALSSDGISWTQVETSQVTSGTTKGLVAVAGGFVAWNNTTMYWTVQPTVVGSWQTFTGALPLAASVTTQLGVDNAKKQLFVVWNDVTNSSTFYRMSDPGRYV